MFFTFTRLSATLSYREKSEDRTSFILKKDKNNNNNNNNNNVFKLKLKNPANKKRVVITLNRSLRKRSALKTLFKSALLKLIKSPGKFTFRFLVKRPVRREKSKLIYRLFRFILIYS